MPLPVRHLADTTAVTPEIRTYTAADGYRLHYRHWRGATPAQATVVALHGIQSHSGWFAWSSAGLAAAGCEVCFLDRRGSGMNEPARGHVEQYSRLVDDVCEFLAGLRDSADQSHPPRPIILMGISWGGKLATVTAARNPGLLDGLVLLYPGLRARIRPGWHQNLRLTLAQWLGIRWKRVRIPLDDPALFTGQPRWRDFIAHDPLALHDVTVSFLLANRALDRLLPACPAAIHCPTLVMLAGKDEIIDTAATADYVRRFASQDLTVIEYPEAHHTLEFEPGRERFIEDLIGWLTRGVDRSATVVVKD